MSARIEAAVERLRVGPRDRILEIGCGHGIAVGLICERLSGGSVVAIDRSKKMIDAAMRRNAVHVAAGRAEFQVCELLEFDPGGEKFDAVLALRVGFFHRHPKEARALVARWLKPGGRVVAEFDEP